jgi:hypothetical protein
MKSGTGGEYGIVGAGAVSASLAGQLPRNSIALGPVAGVSYRVASRIANTLHGGRAVRSFDELDGVRVILFYSTAEYFPRLLQALEAARIQWHGKSLIFLDCTVEDSVAYRFRAAGAGVAKVRRCGVPGHLVVQGNAPALKWAVRLSRELKSKPLEISDASESLFQAAMTMGTAAVTPLLDGVAKMLRECGLRDADAVHLASGLVSGAATEFLHSGRQSWPWHIHEPDATDLLRQLNSLEDPCKSLFRDLLLLGFSVFGRHPQVADAIRDSVIENYARRMTVAPQPPASAGASR